eukprot:CAMPEP_0197569506 /NCGR_PEP_ID=MMETSP1320-20131121/39121_1 /TAXON_ID=91990 /ORGANISM="Bolidomonas sp., Strain RCC2347" /LENGTH=102 /DNA_ID=CAMNT_0043131869 /DNA_START=105 /DNA_END=409 /DNA_ORIENTATION=+
MEVLGTIRPPTNHHPISLTTSRSTPHSPLLSVSSKGQLGLLQPSPQAHSSTPSSAPFSSKRARWTWVGREEVATDEAFSIATVGPRTYIVTQLTSSSSSSSS